MDILQQPDSFGFSSALKDIILQSGENINVSFRIREQEPFLTETYTPDADNKIHIRELGRLFSPYISPVNLRETFVTMREALKSGGAVSLKFWDKKGNIVSVDNVICTSNYHHGNTFNLKFLTSKLFRKVRAVAIFEINDLEVFL
jgi:hypothetical protein